MIANSQTTSLGVIYEDLKLDGSLCIQIADGMG